MKTIKVSEAQGPVLDWAVAKCEGGWVLDPESFTPHHHLGRMNFSTDWAQGGLIIEREHIGLLPSGNAYYERNGGTYYSYGPTPLIAAMRCYVTSKLGETAEVPDELVQPTTPANHTGLGPVPESVEECEFGDDEYQWRLRQAGL